MVTQKNGRRWTTSDHLLEMKFPNVAILTKARAEKIIFKDNLEAVGVKFNYLGDNMFVKAKRALILSSGTVGWVWYKNKDFSKVLHFDKIFSQCWFCCYFGSHMKVREGSLQFVN